AWSHVRIERSDNNTLKANVSVCDDHGTVCVQIENLRFRKTKKRIEVGLYSVDWVEAAASSATDHLQGRWIVIGGDDRRGDLEHLGLACSELNLPGGVDVSAVRSSLRDGLGLGSIEGILDFRSVEAKGFADLGDETSEFGAPATAQAMTLLQALLLEQISPAHGVWFVSDGVSMEGHALQAMRRTVALEFPELKTHFVSLEGGVGVRELVRALETGEAEVRASGKELLVPRLMQQKEAAASRNMDLMPGESGLIEDLRAVEAARVVPLDDEVEIAVEAHGVNFRDVMNALGMLPGLSQRMGGECAGVVERAGKRSGFTRGERVFSFAAGGFRDFVTVKSSNVARVPDGLSGAEAAALPVAYMTALYGLDHLACIREGETVLIHAAAGGLGLAAVNVARARGAKIIATAGSERKREYLRSLGLQDVLPSRTADFADEVMRITDGRGVDVALNSLTGVLAERTLQVLAHGGRFLEVGKRDTLTGDEAHDRRPDVRHFLCDLGEEAEKDAALVPALLREILALLQRKIIAPLPVTEFDDAKEALKFMAQARHIGKIVVGGREADGRRFVVRADATYMVTGGFGGLGLLVAEELVKDGARHIVLAGRREPDVHAQAAIGRMRDLGATVKIALLDIADARGLDEALRQVPDAAPLKGIVHCAGVLEDHGFLEQTAKGLRDVMRPKAMGAWNLHRATQGVALDFFVMFSSAAALFGSAGQANYAAANAALDALAEHRRSLKLPACSIQWGPWRSRGMAERIKTDIDKVGLSEIDAGAGYEAMKSAVESGRAVVAAVAVSSWSRFAGGRPASANGLLEELVEVQNVAIEKKQGLTVEILNVTEKDRREFLCGYLRERTVAILSLAQNTRIDEDEALYDLGLDSLMAVELRNTLAAALERQLSPTLVLDYPTLRTLTDYLLSEVAGEMKPIESEVEIPEDIRTISDDEAEKLLLAELGRRGHGAQR
ncbi:MAG: SDR family NAD(P)-dependent oxidoreductase, partial [Acidobacteria bacterium]|nr:SDR family NAD(P)-dependent oxidoreductase [Acidobacteriota bacterium]